MPVVVVVGWAAVVASGTDASSGNASDAFGAVEPDDDAGGDGCAADEDALALEGALPEAAGGTERPHPEDAHAPGPNPTTSNAAETTSATRGSRR